MADPLEQYRALVAKVVAFWQRAQSLQPQAFQCRVGCDACCRQRLTVCGVEAAAIRAHLAELPVETRDRIRAHEPDPDACVFLHDGQCAIYDARPILCRTHGLALRVDGALDHCPLNFGDVSPEPEGVLDLEQINTLLALVDRLHAEAVGEPAGRPRIPLDRIAGDPP